MTGEPSDDMPWGEAQWERFLRRSEVRSARFGELLETLMDHPDCEAILHREMGWGRIGEGDDDDNNDDVDGADRDEPEYPDDPPMDEVASSRSEGRRDVADLPECARMLDWSARLHDALNVVDARQSDDLVELFAEVIVASMTVGAKIAAGHGMGYDDEVLCGNIVCCRLSLDAARRCERAMHEIRQRRPELDEALMTLIDEGRQLQALIEQRIADLRSRVWWE